MRAKSLLEQRNRLDDQREKYSRSLRSYVEGAWHVVEPATPFVPGWHIDAICEHLEAVSRGQIKGLVINIPPRFAKSLLVCVFWMTWTWTWRPHATWIFASYSEPLAKRDHRKCRHVIASSWYQERWGHLYDLTVERSDWLENNQGGRRIATTVAGFGTGEGGDIKVVDDPHNVLQSVSALERQRALDWWDETMTTRLNDPAAAASVIVMQRLHEADLSGHVLERGGYEHLMLPMEFEADRRCRTSLGWSDPRREEGELLWPQRFTREVVDSLKGPLGTYGVAGQLQQRPAPRGGGYFQDEWLRWYDKPPRHIKKYGASDWATTNEANDYTVHAVFGIDPDDNIYVLDWWRQQCDTLAGAEALIDMMQKHTFDRQGDRVLMAWAQPKDLIAKGVGPFLKKRMRERNVICIQREFPERGDKEVKAQAIQARMEQGMVYFPKNAPWKDALLAELLTFPAAVHDDQVDTLSLLGRMVDRLVPGRVPPKKVPMEIRPPTLNELLKMQPKQDGEKYTRI